MAKKPKVYIGCDPGKSGAIAFVYPNRKVEFIDNDTPPGMLISALKEINRKYNVKGVCIETVHSIQGTSAKSNFVFGFNYGLITGILSSMDAPLYGVTPKVWQKAARCVITPKLTPATRRKKLKELVAVTAGRYYPKAANKLYGPRGGLLDGRSDALLITHYLKYEILKDK